jgi:hypothetical protein
MSAKCGELPLRVEGGCSSATPPTAGLGGNRSFAGAARARREPLLKSYSITSSADIMAARPHAPSFGEAGEAETVDKTRTILGPLVNILALGLGEGESWSECQDFRQRCRRSPEVANQRAACR